MPKRVVIVCGEASGDKLGAGLMRAMQQQHPDIIFEGVGGPLMQAQGFHAWHDSQVLAHMGIIDPLLNIRTLWRVFRDILKRCMREKPDVFVGIDSPDFTLRLAKRLRQKGVKTVHYVSPSVWAWRQGRIHGIKKAIDHMMVLFPFEAPIYQEHDIPVTVVGLTQADRVPLLPTKTDKDEACRALSIDLKRPVLAVMAGSRKGEWQHTLPAIIETLAAFHQNYPSCQIIAPAANAAALTAWQAALKERALPVQCFIGKSDTAMVACDAMLATSGTITLEGMLHKKPMVVVYKMAAFNYWLAKKLVKVPYMALPNLLAQKAIVPEYLQEAVDPTTIALQLQQMIEHPEQGNYLSAYTRLHQELAKNADEQAASVVWAIANGASYATQADSRR